MTDTDETLNGWRDRCLAAYRERHQLRPQVMTAARLAASVAAIERLYRDGNLGALRSFTMQVEFANQRAKQR